MNPIRAESFVPTRSPALTPVPAWPQLPPGLVFDRVVGVALDSHGLIYVAHRGARALLCFHPDGRWLRDVGAAVLQPTTAYDLSGPVPVSLGTRTWLHGLHVDPWDNIWITDVGRHLVMKFSPAGELMLTLGRDGQSGCDRERFAQPTHVAVAPSGEIFVTDGYGNSRVVKFSAAGEYLAEWGQRGTAPGEFHTPHVITIGRQGRLYITDRENDRVQVFDQTGRVLSVWPGLHSVDGFSAAADGFLYGSSGIDHALLRLDAQGRVLDVWTAPAVMLYPHAVARGPDGSLYAADTGDRWVVTGRLPDERYMEPRSGPEGSRLIKFQPAFP